MTTSRKLLLGAATLAVVAVAGCASDPYYDNYAYDRYAYNAPGVTYYSTPGYTYYAPRTYSYGYYYGPRYYSYARPDPFWRYQPQPG